MVCVSWGRSFFDEEIFDGMEGCAGADVSLWSNYCLQNNMNVIIYCIQYNEKYKMFTMRNIKLTMVKFTSEICNVKKHVCVCI